MNFLDLPRPGDLVRNPVTSPKVNLWSHQLLALSGEAGKIIGTFESGIVVALIERQLSSLQKGSHHSRVDSYACLVISQDCRVGWVYANLLAKVMP